MPSEEHDRRTDQWIAHMLHKGHLAMQVMQATLAPSRQQEPTQSPQQQLPLVVQRGQSR
jgi:hypothetical protein